MKYARGGMTSLDYLMEIQRLENELKKHEWISVNDRLPDPLEDVLVIDSNGNIFISWVKEFGNGRFAYENRGDITHITHWMPLPEPPKEEPGE